MANNTPRIFHIHLGDKGGAENFFVRLVRGFHEAGVSQMALTRPDRVWHDEIAGACEVETGGFSSSHIKKFFGHRRVRRMVKEFDADIVMAWMAPATRWVPTGLPGVVPIVRLGDFPDKMEPLYRCQYIVGNTPEIIRRCVMLGWPQENGHVISNFVDPVDIEPMSRAEIGVSKDSFLIVGLGRFVERKGFAYLLKAMIMRPEASLCLLGDGPLKPDFDDFVATHDLGNRVILPGWVTEPQRYIRAADCLCCPSLEEPLGNVVLEGWASGVPVIASDSQGPTWLIDDGVNGLLCTKADGSALASTIGRLRSDVDKKGLVASASAKLEKSYSREQIVSKYLDFFGRITAAE
ncbi:MAG: glycosyltransferase [Rhizobiaceae bacterium]